jgi:hypothetical protein
MRFRSSLCFAAVFLVCFTIAAWYTRLPAKPASGNLRPTPDNQTLWGTSRIRRRCGILRTGDER